MRKKIYSALCKFSYLPNFSYKISKVTRKENVQCVFGNSGKVKEILGNTKDKTDSLAKPGIYSVSCQDCTDEYIGQTKRSISVRFKEHMNCCKKGEIERSAVAKHMLAHHHNCDSSNLKLLKNVKDERLLDGYERWLIQKKRVKRPHRIKPL